MNTSMHYDDFQAMLEQQKSVYLSQNSQLAKYNSSLMMKITDMENKVSELVQENVSLRSRLSMSELRYREKINGVFQTLEEGFMERFMQINQLFDSVREGEGLQPGRNDGDFRSILKHSNGISPKGVKTVGFKNTPNVVKAYEMDDPILEDHNEHSGNSIELNEHEVQPLRKRRRKSSRRESLFIPADFEFNDEDPEVELNTAVIDEDEPLKTTVNHFEEEQQESTDNDVIEASTSPTSNIKSAVATEENVVNTETAPIEDDSYNFTTSVIEYSIPEESSIHDHSHILMETSKPKIDVYDDREELHIHTDDTMNIIQCAIPSQSKIKHSMKYPRTRLKGGRDDVMPHTDYEKDDEKRERRTRGKAVNYKLPSLRAKMRRPTEKFVDATTVTDIHDLQVKRKGDQQQVLLLGEYEKRNSDDYGTSCSGTLPTDLTSDTGNTKKSLPPLPLHEIRLTENKNQKMVLKELPPNVIKNKSKIATTKQASQVKDLKAITNVQPTILSSNKIPADENLALDTLPPSLDDTKGKAEPISKIIKTDLSAFEIIDGISLKQVARTHRVKAKEELSKKRKRVTYEEAKT
ncbi:unnamed protein product [Kluyveromyces dobzhanskii CBS 2104]|uniref:WGS project CCBQ000000000 data, contig 00107 n=1 Tax=Kluyveromyces dobzhanskii CBS 2104 TaxID=1427455 RepID=A0A0A8L0Z8_9SACH|nr:unnamed protein product [Kluyveromyces dobzhanskii CBS 2104]